MDINLFINFLNELPAAAFVKDLEGRHIYCNKFFEQRFGLKPGELIGKTDFVWAPDEIVQQFRQSDLEAAALGKKFQRIDRVPDPNGQIRQWVVVKFPLRSATGEKFVGGIALDITENGSFVDPDIRVNL